MAASAECGVLRPWSLTGFLYLAPRQRDRKRARAARVTSQGRLVDRVSLKHSSSLLRFFSPASPRSLSGFANPCPRLFSPTHPPQRAGNAGAVPPGGLGSPSSRPSGIRTPWQPVGVQPPPKCPPSFPWKSCQYHPCRSEATNVYESIEGPSRTVNGPITKAEHSPKPGTGRRGN